MVLFCWIVFSRQFQNGLNVLSFLKEESFLKVGLHHLRMLLSIYSCCLLANALLAQGQLSLCKCGSVPLQNWWKFSNLVFWSSVWGVGAAWPCLPKAPWKSLGRCAPLLCAPSNSALTNAVLLFPFSLDSSVHFYPFLTLIARSLPWESLCCIFLPHRGHVQLQPGCGEIR